VIVKLFQPETSTNPDRGEHSLAAVAWLPEAVPLADFVTLVVGLENL
jgi:hypothetical protein